MGAWDDDLHVQLASSITPDKTIKLSRRASGALPDNIKNAESALHVCPVEGLDVMPAVQ